MGSRPAEERPASAVSTIVDGLRRGFHVGLPQIEETWVPSNHGSATRERDMVRGKIAKEVEAGRYLGPMSVQECEELLGGPFQSSPIALAPKPPDGWRFIQDASYPLRDPRRRWAASFHKRTHRHG